MIVTFTANPSVDRTAEVTELGDLDRSAVGVKSVSRLPP